MAITTSWNITSMDASTSDGFVYTARWKITASDSSVGVNTFIGESSFSVRPDPLISYNSLTEDIVLGWVKTGIGSTTIAHYEKVSGIGLTIANRKGSDLPWV
tara:strand:+ start:365 stop:670 length:306 start_codon:yes stop_codon:yes gene_type:complete